MMVTCGESHFLCHKGTLSWICVLAAHGLALGLCLFRAQTYLLPVWGEGFIFGSWVSLGPGTISSDWAEHQGSILI